MAKCSFCGYELKSGQTQCPACRRTVGDAKSGKPRGNRESSDFEKSSLFIKYADLLDNDALYQAALCKLNGIAVEKNKSEAFEMLRILAFRGHLDAMHKLAQLLMGSEFADEEAGLKWLQIAAGEGHKPSQVQLKMIASDDNPPKKVLTEKFQNASSSLEGLVREALPCIVTINVGHAKDKKKEESRGSGFILDGGYVVTNAHVIGEDPYYITANFEADIDPKPYNLCPLSIETKLDLAILKFTGLAEKKFAARDNLNLRLGGVEYGEDVYTIGNPLGIGLSVTKGIVACPNRVTNYPPAVGEVIQTDMTINHGNSGGALLDMQNQVVGVTTYTLATSGGGMAMCVPAARIDQVIKQIKNL